MSLAGLLRLDSLFKGTTRPRPLVALCAIDIVSQGLCQYGLAVAGSSLYIVIYSSCTMWIAIESRIIIGRRLATFQWLGCAIVVLGLGVTGGDMASSLARGGLEVALGASMILVGSISHALTWVLVELLLKHADDPMRPEAVSTVMGFAGVATFGLWQLVYTVPRAQALVFDQITSHGGDTATIGQAYLVLTLASLAHAVTFYHLVGHMGAVTAGVMKGCQAVAVFVASDYLFCGAQASQCFTGAKAWSLLLVVLGTTTYVLSGRGQPAPEVNMEGTYYRAYNDDEAAPAGWVRHSDGGFVRIRGESGQSPP